MPLTPEDVRTRLAYARVRIDELIALNGGDLLGADADERQQLSQEVFFHLVGAIEVFAQLINEQRQLGRASEDVSISRLNDSLPASDGLRTNIAALYANTRRPAPVSDLYSGDGLMYRVWNYRHQVTHRRANPFHLNVSFSATVSAGSAPARRNRRFLPRRGSGLGVASTPQHRSAHFRLDPRIRRACRLGQLFKSNSTGCTSSFAPVLTQRSPRSDAKRTPRGTGVSWMSAMRVASRPGARPRDGESSVRHVVGSHPHGSDVRREHTGAVERRSVGPFTWKKTVAGGGAWSYQDGVRLIRKCEIVERRALVRHEQIAPAAHWRGQHTAERVEVSVR